MPSWSPFRSEEVRKGRFAPPKRPFFSPQSGHQGELNDTGVDVPLQVAALRWIGWPESSEYADAWANPEEADQLAEQALALDPQCVDAHLFLAIANADRSEKAMEFAFQALEAGDQIVKREPEAAEEGHLWSYLPARPYLRARAFLARYVWGLGGRIMATTLAHESLELDGDDALGLRYLLLSWYLDMGEEMLTHELLNQYKDERSTILLYGDALLTFWDRGDDRTSKARLNKALKANPHVPEQMFGPPPDIADIVATDAYAPGSEEEALICALLLSPAWKGYPEAREWLEEASERRR